jgi:hypothetical protein
MGALSNYMKASDIIPALSNEHIKKALSFYTDYSTGGGSHPILKLPFQYRMFSFAVSCTPVEESNPPLSTVTIKYMSKLGFVRTMTHNVPSDLTESNKYTIPEEFQRPMLYFIFNDNMTRDNITKILNNPKTVILTTTYNNTSINYSYITSKVGTAPDERAFDNLTKDKAICSKDEVMSIINDKERIKTNDNQAYQIKFIQDLFNSSKLAVLYHDNETGQNGMIYKQKDGPIENTQSHRSPPFALIFLYAYKQAPQPESQIMPNSGAMLIPKNDIKKHINRLQEIIDSLYEQYKIFYVTHNTPLDYIPNNANVNILPIIIHNVGYKLFIENIEEALPNNVGLYLVDYMYDSSILMYVHKQNGNLIQVELTRDTYFKDNNYKKKYEQVINHEFIKELIEKNQDFNLQINYIIGRRVDMTSL